MNHTVLKCLAILLVLCVLSVGGLAQAQSVEHAGHHAQHQAATHGTLLCSWMCAAGTVLDTAVVTFLYEMVYERSGERYRATGRDLWVFQSQNAAWIAVWRAMLALDEMAARVPLHASERVPSQASE